MVQTIGLRFTSKPARRILRANDPSPYGRNWPPSLRPHHRWRTVREELSYRTTPEGPSALRRIRIPIRYGRHLDNDNNLAPHPLKRRDQPWFCVDYRRLNAATRDEAAPLPIIQEMLRDLGQAKVFSSLNLKSGYWQVLLSDVSKGPLLQHPKRVFTSFG
jgi:hypothetical protein